MRWITLLVAMLAPVAGAAEEYWDGGPGSSPAYALVEHEAIAERLSPGEQFRLAYPNVGSRIAITDFDAEFVSVAPDEGTITVKVGEHFTVPFPPDVNAKNQFDGSMHPAVRQFMPSLGGTQPEIGAEYTLSLEGARVYVYTPSNLEGERFPESKARDALNTDFNVAFTLLPGSWTVYHHPVDAKLTVEEGVARRHQRARRVAALGFGELAKVAHLQATRYWVDGQWYPQAHQGDSSKVHVEPDPLDPQGTGAALTSATQPEVFERIEKALAEAGIQAAVRRLVTRYYDSPEGRPASTRKTA